MALESELEKAVCKWVESLGGRALKLKLENERGFPDRTIILPHGFIGFVELKRASGSTKKYEQQKRKVDWLKAMGLPAAFCSTLEEVKEFCK